MTRYVMTDRERECTRLLEDARELVERLARIAEVLPVAKPSQEREAKHFKAMERQANEAIALLRGKIEDAEALVRYWGK